MQVGFFKGGGGCVEKEKKELCKWRKIFCMYWSCPPVWPCLSSVVDIAAVQPSELCNMACKTPLSCSNRVRDTRPESGWCVDEGCWWCVRQILIFRVRQKLKPVSLKCRVNEGKERGRGKEWWRERKSVEIACCPTFGHFKVALTLHTVNKEKNATQKKTKCQRFCC